MGDYTSNEAGVRNTNALPSPGLVHGRTRQESKPLEDSHSRAICDADRCSCVDARFIGSSELSVGDRVLVGGCG